MEIHGREIHFRRTVLANCEIAEACPEGDINKLDAVLHDKYAVAQKTAAVVMAALSKGYEMEQHFNDPSYKMRPLTVDEALLMDNDDFNALFVEALNVWADDGKTTIETEEPKAKGKNATGDSE